MTSPRLFALVATAVLAGALAATAFARGTADFNGKARMIALTPGEAGYKALLTSIAAQRPAVDMRSGYRSGWQASYLKGTAAVPVQTYSVIYVYNSKANARRAYAVSCSSCGKTLVTSGIRMKFEQRSASGEPVVTTIATCRNVYVVIVISAKKSLNTLAADSGALIGGIFRKAMARGMSPCTSG
jgi:hypothetical protein